MEFSNQNNNNNNNNNNQLVKVLTLKSFYTLQNGTIFISIILLMLYEYYFIFGANNLENKNIDNNIYYFLSIDKLR